MHYVYLLRSVQHPNEFYVGQSENLKGRLAAHNDGQSIYTQRHKPWNLVWYSAFQTREAALRFEKYLKSGSGKTFLRRHFI